MNRQKKERLKKNKEMELNLQKRLAEIQEKKERDVQTPQKKQKVAPQQTKDAPWDIGSAMAGETLVDLNSCWLIQNWDSP